MRRVFGAERQRKKSILELISMKAMCAVCNEVSGQVPYWREGDTDQLDTVLVKSIVGNCTVFLFKNRETSISGL